MIRQMIKKILELKQFIEEEEFGFDDNVNLAEDYLLELMDELQEELKEIEEEILNSENYPEDTLLLEFLKGERDLIKDFLSSLR